MALFRLHITLPDRPGSLGAVASAIGFAAVAEPAVPGGEKAVALPVCRVQ